MEGDLNAQLLCPIRTEKSSKAATARLEIAEAVTGLLQVHSCIWAYKGGKADGMRLASTQTPRKPRAGFGCKHCFRAGFGCKHCFRAGFGCWEARTAYLVEAVARTAYFGQSMEPPRRRHQHRMRLPHTVISFPDGLISMHRRPRLRGGFIPKGILIIRNLDVEQRHFLTLDR